VEHEERSVERLVRAGLLYDFYGGLLTSKQRQAFELYCWEDWSLAEIATSEGVSRQAVHDLISRSEKTMSEFEEKLGLVERFQKQQKVIDDIAGRIEGLCRELPEGNHIRNELVKVQTELVQLADSERE
jgi:predicted DNA-binding protein YlxM (UPF0122 family)